MKLVKSAGPSEESGRSRSPGDGNRGKNGAASAFAAGLLSLDDPRNVGRTSLVLPSPGRLRAWIAAVSAARFFMRKDPSSVEFASRKPGGRPTNAKGFPMSLTCLITGANRGLGRATALELAKSGATVVMACRDAKRGEAAVEAVRAASGNPKAELLILDLSSLESVRRAAAEFSERHTTLDALLHNAAIYRKERVLTADGLESMFATNHLGPFLLTQLLLDRLASAPSGRVISVSAPVRIPKVDWDNLQSEKSFRPVAAFGASKAFNLLAAYRLSRALGNASTTSNAFFPGLVKSDLMTALPFPARWVLNAVSAPPERPARNLAFVATSEEYVQARGEFIAGRKIKKPSRSSRDAALQDRVWEVSMKLAGLEDSAAR
jgi:NAD(P)-dependent dehydrogenase (short-subunit alcohol dehydrogenase family)